MKSYIQTYILFVLFNIMVFPTTATAQVSENSFSCLNFSSPDSINFPSGHMRIIFPKNSSATGGYLKINDLGDLNSVFLLYFSGECSGEDQIICKVQAVGEKTTVAVYREEKFSSNITITYSVEKKSGLMTFENEFAPEPVKINLSSPSLCE